MDVNPHPIQSQEMADDKRLNQIVKGTLKKVE